MAGSRLYMIRYINVVGTLLFYLIMSIGKIHPRYQAFCCPILEIQL